jgi:hypothetical protein
LAAGFFVLARLAGVFFLATGFFEPADLAIFDRGSSDDGQMSANSHT